MQVCVCHLLIFTLADVLTLLTFVASASAQQKQGKHPKDIIFGKSASMQNFEENSYLRVLGVCNSLHYPLWTSWVNLPSSCGIYTTNSPDVVSYMSTHAPFNIMVVQVAVIRTFVKSNSGPMIQFSILTGRRNAAKDPCGPDDEEGLPPRQEDRPHGGDREGPARPAGKSSLGDAL